MRAPSSKRTAGVVTECSEEWETRGQIASSAASAPAFNLAFALWIAFHCRRYSSTAPSAPAVHPRLWTSLTDGHVCTNMNEDAHDTRTPVLRPASLIGTGSEHGRASMERLSISALAAAAQQRHAGAQTRGVSTGAVSFVRCSRTFVTLTISDRGPWQAGRSTVSRPARGRNGARGEAAQRA